MVLELLKNSARATIETSSSQEEIEARPFLWLHPRFCVVPFFSVGVCLFVPIVSSKLRFASFSLDRIAKSSVAFDSRTHLKHNFCESVAKIITFLRIVVTVSANSGQVAIRVQDMAGGSCIGTRDDL